MSLVRWGRPVAQVAFVVGGIAGLLACGEPASPPPPAVAEAPAPPTADVGPAEPLPSLVVVQAAFTTEGGRPKPGPATMVLLRKEGETWHRVEITDPESNVFHKAMPWRGGLLTIGAMKAKLKHWTKGADGVWAARTLWERSWGGRFDRLRDVELADFDGDGREEIVLATHDQGVVAVGREGADGAWTFTELDQKPDTFVHEIEIGDVDGDGRKEFYATPSARNRASGESQPGSVVRYDLGTDGTWTRSTVVEFAESHAKEILVADMDSDGTDELYVVREAHTVKEGEGTKRVDPVRVVRFSPGSERGWTEQVVATLDDDQCRFALAADVDADGARELVLAGYKSGIWYGERSADGTFTMASIDRESSGFEHAAHAADLDGDGKVELYVAADDQKEIRRYTWNGSGFVRTVIAPVGPAERTHITWNLQDGRL